METIEKAAIRIKHWVEHNDRHVEDYEKFAAELEGTGAKEAARNIRDMAELTRRCGDCLNDALRSLKKVSG